MNLDYSDSESEDDQQHSLTHDKPTLGRNEQIENSIREGDSLMKDEDIQYHNRSSHLESNININPIYTTARTNESTTNIIPTHTTNPNLATSTISQMTSQNNPQHIQIDIQEKLSKKDKKDKKEKKEKRDKTNSKNNIPFMIPGLSSINTATVVQVQKPIQLQQQKRAREDEEMEAVIPKVELSQNAQKILNIPSTKSNVLRPRQLQRNTVNTIDSIREEKLLYRKKY